MQIFRLAGALFSLSCRSVLLCLCCSSAKGAGPVDAFCQGKAPLFARWRCGLQAVLHCSLRMAQARLCLKDKVVAVVWWFQHRWLLHRGSWHPEPLSLAQHSWGVRYSLWRDEHKGSRLLKIKLVELWSNFTFLTYLLMIIFSWEAVFT